MTSRTNDEWLSDLTAEGSPRQVDAINALQERLRRGLFYYLSRERSDLTDLTYSELEHMAADFAQEALLRILKNIHTFRGDSLFTTWATKVAVRVAISELRRARYRDFSLENVTIDGEIMPALAPNFEVGQTTSPERSAERSDVMEKIEAAIMTALTDRQRTALMAVGIRGVPLEIVAEQMSTNRNALYKLLHDARTKLKAELEKQGISMDYLKRLFEE